MRRPRWPPQGKPSIESGSRLLIVVARWMLAVTIRGAPAPQPTAARAASSRLPIVALIAQVRSPGRSCRSQLRQSSACTPRLLPISSCHSSSTTACSAPNSSGALPLASSRLSDSGVVIRIWGGERSCLPRSWLLVSPLRIASRRGQPIASIGAWMASARSRLRARRGVR